ncbi:hypothetical protein EY920_24140 [Citrobacter braakii]|uniref:ECs_2282 family putative zinc-binding protein n=1 Tax=Citrobacter braakii TaxID=57706 RepID=UPI00103966C4|nr:hypothetical protein [Citrobacter braakii]TCC61594.1 hypothetical protein EY920_24140 [Citrobacter braakii]
MFIVSYKCPKCGHLTELPSVDVIYNSQDVCPVECKECGTKFRKEDLLRFTKHKAEKLVKEALSKIQKHISNIPNEPIITGLPRKKKKEL